MLLPTRANGTPQLRNCRAFLAGIVVAIALTGSAPAQQPSPAQIAAAKDVVVASGMSRSFEVFVPQIMQQLMQTLTRTRPELATDLEAVLKQLEPEFQARQSEMIETAALSFAKRMSEGELKDTATFFKSPSGKKYVESQPAILDEVVTGIQGWTQKLSNDIMDRARAEMKKKGHDF
ncbi:MAG: DUF2059 domain-containing protein [Methylobacteriaceae bacterium]|nr:DUF2059 domain-containing protein [Methylobacteriaceae bacterium]MBV9243378.1 DUF2059 domain-containing protein [Methylobacteriaceae bacterium]MBV9634601.1 DUF2059 domain-containing protein [Methylobacteriaceae bacterium]MBV9704536.1 DUF2059 domain-containing protein [Methylobacteriaceae bacterium]